MPMYQGNYVAPVWTNDTTPAINDTELLAMSGTIQASQILTGSGAPTQYTSGTAGQRYADTSTTPPTMYKLKTATEDANVWVIDDANGNIAAEYNPNSTYVKAQYCIHDGLLYRALQDINPAESWNQAHWYRCHVGNDIIIYTQIAQTMIGAKADPPEVGSISFSASWTGSASPYTQTVTVTGATVTANSKVDIQLTAAQIESLISDGVTGLIIENNNGVLTAYAVGAVPSASMTVQCTIVEANLPSGTTSVWGNRA